MTGLSCDQACSPGWVHVKVSMLPLILICGHNIIKFLQHKESKGTLYLKNIAESQGYKPENSQFLDIIEDTISRLLQLILH